MNVISFMTANYVARQNGYHVTEGWMQGDNATNAYFRPVETFAQRLNEYLTDVKTIGFEAVDLWIAILNPAWATQEHIALTKDLLARHNLRVMSLAGWAGSTPDELERTCRLMRALNIGVLGGWIPLLAQDRARVVGMLQDYGLKLGIENHDEKTPDEVLAKIGDGGGGTLGATVDTGWWGTQSYNPVQAIEALADHILVVHLNDVLAAGAHNTCRYGRGCVPVRECVLALQRIGYAGAITVEHEPYDFDPTEDCIANLALVKEWLS